MIIVPNLMDVSWLYQSLKHPYADNDVEVGQLEDVGSACPDPKPTYLKAFDIISLLSRCNLWRFFKDDVVKKEESRFTLTQLASRKMMKLEERS